MGGADRVLQRRARVEASASALTSTCALSPNTTDPKACPPPEKKKGHHGVCPGTQYAHLCPTPSPFPQFLDVVAHVLVPILFLNFEPVKMAIMGFVLGHNCRIMRRAFGSGTLQYRVLVAIKPNPPLAVSEASVSDVTSTAAMTSEERSGVSEVSVVSEGEESSDLAVLMDAAEGTNQAPEGTDTKAGCRRRGRATAAAAAARVDGMCDVARA